MIDQLIKTSGPGRQQPVLVLPKFANNNRRCVFTYIEHYLERTKQFRTNHTKLFVSFCKPHKPVSRDTVSRWIRTGLGEAGIDLSTFAPHSIRSAATSAAKMAAVPLASIMRAGTWTKDSTFRRFYDKPIDIESDFALAVLN